VILVTLSIAVPPGRREEIVQVFWSLMGPVRVEAGCLGCGLYQAVSNEDVLVYAEEWETPEQLERHVRSARYERLLSIMEASIRPPVLRYHMVSGVKGLEYVEALRLGARASAPPAKDQPTLPSTASQQRQRESNKQLRKNRPARRERGLSDD
jgi:quinol monooxygenase YgiN